MPGEAVAVSPPSDIRPERSSSGNWEIYSSINNSGYGPFLPVRLHRMRIRFRVSWSLPLVQALGKGRGYEDHGGGIVYTWRRDKGYDVIGLAGRQGLFTLGGDDVIGFAKVCLHCVGVGKTHLDGSNK